MSKTKQLALNIMKEIDGAWDLRAFDDYNGDPQGIIMSNDQCMRIHDLFKDIQEYIRIVEDLPEENRN